MTDLERAERRMRQRWYDVALTEGQGQPAEALQQRYDLYFAALHAYVALFEAAAGQEQQRAQIAS